MRTAGAITIPTPRPATGDPAYTASLHAADLAGLIDALNLGPVHLVTSSFGGCVALALAVARPELVRSLVLAEPPLMPWLEHIPGGAPLAQAFYADAWLPAQRAFREGDSERGVRLFLDACRFGRDAFDRLSASGRRMILDNAPEMRAETLSPDIFPALTCADVTALDRPVLLLNGELSPRLFHLINAELARCLPRAAQAVIPADLARDPCRESGGVSCRSVRVSDWIMNHLTHVMASVQIISYTDPIPMVGSRPARPLVYLSTPPTTNLPMELRP